jgi:hypothetical protein
LQLLQDGARGQRLGGLADFQKQTKANGCQNVSKKCATW